MSRLVMGEGAAAFPWHDTPIRRDTGSHSTPGHPFDAPKGHLHVGSPGRSGDIGVRALAGQLNNQVTVRCPDKALISAAQMQPTPPQSRLTALPKKRKIAQCQLFIGIGTRGRLLGSNGPGPKRFIPRRRGAHSEFDAAKPSSIGREQRGECST
jgi:hypothetical protein